MWLDSFPVPLNFSSKAQNYTLILFAGLWVLTAPACEGWGYSDVRFSKVIHRVLIYRKKELFCCLHKCRHWLLLQQSVCSPRTHQLLIFWDGKPSAFCKFASIIQCGFQRKAKMPATVSIYLIIHSSDICSEAPICLALEAKVRKIKLRCFQETQPNRKDYLQKYSSLGKLI